MELSFTPTFDPAKTVQRLDRLLVASPLPSPELARRIERLEADFRSYARCYPLPLWAPGLDLTAEISEKPYIVFVARTKWTQPDSTDPYAHNDGFQIVNIAPRDEEIFQRIVAKYGTPETKW